MDPIALSMHASFLTRMCYIHVISMMAILLSESQYYISLYSKSSEIVSDAHFESIALHTVTHHRQQHICPDFLMFPKFSLITHIPRPPRRWPS